MVNAALSESETERSAALINADWNFVFGGLKKLQSSDWGAIYWPKSELSQQHHLVAKTRLEYSRLG